MTLKLAVAGARSFAAVAGGAPVALAQPAVSAVSTVIAASVVASHRDAVMTIRRIPDRIGSGCKCTGSRAPRRGAVQCGGPVPQRRIPLTGADRQPVLLDDLPVHTRGCEPGAGDIGGRETLLNRAGIRPGQCIAVTSVMIGACVAL